MARAEMSEGPEVAVNLVTEPGRPSPSERLLGRLALVGAAPGDSEEVRVQKATLTLAAVIVTLLAVVWVATYFALGLPVSAAIPFAYQVASVVSLVAFARTTDFRFFRFSQLMLMLLLPFLLQWSLGGYRASSAVSLWALVGVLGALFFLGAREAIPWFVAFVALTILSGLADPWLSGSPATIPTVVVEAFFVLNIVGVSLTTYLLLQYFVRQRDAALAQSEGLLLNVLPRSIAERLKRDPGVIAEAHDEVTVLFADVVDFTAFTERTEPSRVVGLLDEIFSAFDALAERHGVEKIKTIGDAYMAASGLPTPRVDHAEAMAAMALDMRAAFGELCTVLGLDLAIRIGMDSGPVVAGVIGRHKFIYDLWGDTVNTASRMESHGLPGAIQVSEAVYRRLSHDYEFEARGEIEVKGKGRRLAYLLIDRQPEAELDLDVARQRQSLP
jgi:adenylate cyclase